MGVYVDDAVHGYGRMLMCHMIADTAEELHRMAERIGIARRHYQSPAKVSFPHYDICKSKRAEALKAGAVEIDRRYLGQYMKNTKQRLIAQGKTWGDTDWL